MREFKRNVIKPAIEESNDRSSFVVNIEDIKLGRKIAAFELSVKGKKKIDPICDEISSNLHAEIRNEIQKTFGKISEQVLSNILKNYSKEYILEKIAYTRQYAKTESLGKYPIPYFISALRDDYKSNKDYQLALKTKPEPSALKEWEDKQQDLISDIMHWENQITNSIDATNLEINQKILSDCRKKLEEHRLNKPNGVV
jgi:plasmid replication initiation protein